MSSPEMPRAELRRAPSQAESGIRPEALRLSLEIDDREVLDELLRRESPERERFAAQCLRVGVLALRYAGSAVDADKIRQEGDRLVGEVEARLKLHAGTLNQKLEGELKRYFDPESGHFQERVRSLTAEDGKLATVLKRHLEGDSSVLARNLAQAVGENSPLMRYLSPREKDGLIETLARTVQERLEQQTGKVLGEFDLNREDSALNRLIKSVHEISQDIGRKFDAEDDKSPMARMHRALEATREQIRSDLSLDQAESPLSNLHDKLKKQIAELVERQAKFQNEVSEVLGELRGVKQEREKSPSGGFEFEKLVEQALRQTLPAEDLLEAVGETTGSVRNCKTGDLLHTLGPDSAAPGACVVYECKRDNSYTLKKALEELDLARKNRGAKVGVFVLAASSVRDTPRMQQDFAQPLRRYGQDVMVVWDAEDEGSRVRLDAAATLARWMLLQESKEQSALDEVDWEAVDKAVNGLEKQYDHFEKMQGWCNNITRDSDNIRERLRIMRSDIERDLKRLKEQLDVLR